MVSVTKDVGKCNKMCLCTCFLFARNTRAPSDAKFGQDFPGQTTRRSERRVFLPGEAESEEHAACPRQEEIWALRRGVPRPPPRAVLPGDGQDAQGRRLPREDHAPDQNEAAAPHHHVCPSPLMRQFGLVSACCRGGAGDQKMSHVA